MTKEEKYILAKWVMNYSLQNGAQEVSVSIANNQNSNIEVREQKIDKLEQATQNSLTIRLFVDKKYSVHSTNRLKREELALFIDEAIAGTRYLAQDEYRTLPAPELYYRGGGKNLHVIDATFETIKPEEKIEMAFATEKEVVGKDERIISVTASYYDGLNHRVLVNSNGFEGDTSNSYFGLNASVSVKTEDARPSASWSESAIFFEKLKKDGVGQMALDKALKKIGQKKIASGKMSMIVENRQVGRLLGPLISALSGSAIQQKSSFLINKLNQKVISEKLSITDNPFIAGGRGSRHFDGEGIATIKRTVFEKGILKTYYIDTYYSKKLNMEATSGSTTNLEFETGDKDLQGLIRTMQKGIMVTGFNGGNSNGTTGDFSFGIEGFLVENGEIIQPVSEMNITGNLIDLWSNIGDLGDDINTNSSWLTPSVLFEGVDFSGS